MQRSWRLAPGQGAAGEPSVVEGTLSDAVVWRMDPKGEHFTVDGHVRPLLLRHATATIVQVPEGHVQGRLGRIIVCVWMSIRPTGTTMESVSLLDWIAFAICLAIVIFLWLQ